MNVWYAFLNALGIRMFEMDFMKNALLAVLLLGPLFGLLSTMIVTGKNELFLRRAGPFRLYGHRHRCALRRGAADLFRGRAVGSVRAAVFLRPQPDEPVGGHHHRRLFLHRRRAWHFHRDARRTELYEIQPYLIGDILSVSPQEIGLLALVLLAVVLLWVFGSNRLVLTAVHPQLASSRGVATKRNETLFTVAIAIVVTLAMSWVGLMVINSLLVLPAAASRNLARNLRQYHLLSVLSALVCGLLGLCAAYWLGCSAGATIALLLAVYFAVSFALRNRAA